MRIPPDALIPMVPMEKLTKYLLVARERDDKSKFLAQAGFTQQNPHLLLRHDLAAAKVGRPGTIRDAEAPEGEELMKLPLYQHVALRRDVPEHGLKAGDLATLVDYVPHPEGSEEGCVLEVFNAVGESIAVVIVPRTDIEGLNADEILAVRPLSKVS